MPLIGALNDDHCTCWTESPVTRQLFRSNLARHRGKLVSRPAMIMLSGLAILCNGLWNYRKNSIWRQLYVKPQVWSNALPLR